MTLGPVEVTSRDIATLFWWTVIAAAVLLGRSTRESMRGVLHTGARLLWIVGLYAGWVALLGLLATRIPFGDQRLWEPAQLKDTIVWFAVTGMALLFGVGQSATDRRFYVTRVVEVISGASLLQIFLGLVTFELWIEVLWPVPIVLVSLMLVVAARDPAMAALRKVLTVIQVLLVLGLLGAVLVILIDQLPHYDWGAQLHSFLLTVWLTVGALPLIAWLSLYSNYQSAFGHLRKRDGSAASLTAKLAVLSTLHVRNRELLRFAGYWPRQTAEADGFWAARRVVRQFRADLQERDAVVQQQADDLVHYAGVEGTDEEGRQLDRREFVETQAALEWLANNCHMGWYRNQEPKKRYKADLLKIFQPGHTRGLPDEHGISMKVRGDGQAWFAWRRTTTGWVFGIGAKGSPPSEWFYEGPEPPKGYPGSGPGWGSSAFERGPNWS